MKTSLLGMAALAAAATLSAQSTARMPDPGANGGMTPSSSTSYPWNRIGSYANVLYMYGNASFASQGITFPILIGGVDTWSNAAAGANVATYPNVTVYVGEGAPGIHAAYDLTQTFGWHYLSGALPTPAFTGSVTTVANGAPGYFAPVTFPAPVLFDPTGGADLCVQYENDGTAATGSGSSSYGPGAAGSLTSRIYTLTAGGPPQFGNTTFGVETQITYTPAAGLYPSFTVDTESGNAPLTVNFTDTTFTSDPAGILAWIWDFDNDGTPDSNAQNPSHTYTACGDYSVSLTVLDAMHGTQSILRSNLIAVDPLAASFTYAALGANTVQFTDTSSSTASSWAWDFDNDGNVDSTAQNPTHTYAAGGFYTASLTVTNSCRSATYSESVPTFPLLCTNFDANNGLSSSGSGNFFDITITNPNGVLITGLDIYTYTTVASGKVEVWTIPTTYIGNETNPAAWTKVAEANNVTFTGNPGDFADISDFFLAPGTYGMRISTDAGVRYTNGIGTNQAFSNADMALALGASSSNFGSPITPRVWNGCIYYENGPTGYYSYHKDSACNSSAGHVHLTGTTPRIGAACTVTLDGMPASTAAIMVLGYSDTSVPGLGPLPLALDPFGLTGCMGNIAPQDTFLLFGDPAGTTFWTLNIPNVPAFVGTAFYNQAMVVDGGINAAGAVMSDSGFGVVGQ